MMMMMMMKIEHSKAYDWWIVMSCKKAVGKFNSNPHSLHRITRLLAARCAIPKSFSEVAVISKICVALKCLHAEQLSREMREEF